MTVLVLDAPQREVPQPLKSVQALLMRARLVFDEPRLPDVLDVTTSSDVHAQINTSPATTAAVTTMISASAPVSLTDELAVFCPQRAPPVYPRESRHLREEGEVTLRVELDESGHVSAAIVLKSSGSLRLDTAARTAVLTWRCNAVMHDGQPVRAVAIQSLDFNLRPR
jgi:protein TonB